jgi:hypothetical protein
MSRGAVTAYVRVPAPRIGEGIRLLRAAGYVAERDNGDPDRPVETVDLFVEQHYGMIDPDRRIRDQLHRGLGLVLDAAGISHEYRSGGVVCGGEYPTCRQIPVMDAGTLNTIGFTIRVPSARQAATTMESRSLTFGRERIRFAIR